MKHFLKLLDCTKEDIIDILNLADQLKYETHNNILHKHLEGKTLAMIFQKSSTRTRISFETGMFQLGGHALFLGVNDIQIGRGEPTEDTARVISRYCDGVMIRTFEQQEVEDFASYGTVPVINGLTDFAHPCQVLADLMTIREQKIILEGLKACFIGDVNNMSNSLIVGCLKVGMSISLASPNNCVLPDEILEFTKDYGDKFSFTSDIKEAIKDADVVITDVWTSMGSEHEQEERKERFKSYQINKENMSYAKEDAIVLHCLPAHREEEITTEMFDKHADVIFDEAENRLHAQKAVMVKLMKNK